MVDFYLQPMKQPFVGREKSWPYVIRVVPSVPQGRPAAGIEGQVVVAPQIPAWLAALLLLLLLLLCGLVAWALPMLLPFLGN